MFLSNNKDIFVKLDFWEVFTITLTYNEEKTSIEITKIV